LLPGDTAAAPADLIFMQNLVRKWVLALRHTAYRIRATITAPAMNRSALYPNAHAMLRGLNRLGTK